MSIADRARPGGIEVTVEAEGDTCIVRLLGEFDASGVNDVNEALARAEAGEATTIILDIDRLGFIDSSGLAALLEASRRSDGSGRLRLTRGSGHVAQMLQLTGIDQALPFE